MREVSLLVLVFVAFSRDGLAEEKRTWIDNDRVYTTKHAGDDTAYALAQQNALSPKRNRGQGGWTKFAGALGWIGSFACVGNGGRHAFSFYDLNNTAAALFPVLNVNPPQEVWELYSDPYNPSQPHGVGAAKLADVYVSIVETPDRWNPRLRFVDIQRYSLGGRLVWTYRYPHSTDQATSTSASHIGVSDDGETIVATAHNPLRDQNDILVFTRSHGTPRLRHELPSGPVWRFDLSADGSLLALGIDTTIYVVEVNTGVVRYSQDLASAISAKDLTISGDGSILAYSLGSGVSAVRVMRWNGTIYNTLYHVFSPIGGNYSALELSNDGSTLAAGISLPFPSTVTRIEAIDVASGGWLMGDTLVSVPGPNQYQNAVYDVAISATGERLAAALFGDEEIFPLVEEVRIYDAHSNTPIKTRNLPGSAFDIDMSLDGAWVVVGSKALHANELGRGGRIDLIAVP